MMKPPPFRCSVLLCLLLSSVLVGLEPVPEAEERAFVGAEACGACHEVEHRTWSKTRHAVATNTVKVWGGPLYGPHCLQCHATNRDDNMAGVQCEMCHGAGSDYATAEVMRDPQKARKRGLVIPDQETCDACHDDEDHHVRVDLEQHLAEKWEIHELGDPPQE